MQKLEIIGKFSKKHLSFFVKKYLLIHLYMINKYITIHFISIYKNLQNT